MSRPLLLALCLSATSAAAEPITTIAPSDLAWAKTPEGVAFAPLSGDRFKEAYAAMVELPGGLVSPPHTKSAEMYGIVVTGTMTHVPQGADPLTAKPLAQGGYYHIPANLPHISACISPEPCIAFLYQPGAFDFLPVTQ